MNNNIHVPAVKGWTPQQVEAIKRTVAIHASNEELTMFLYLSRKTGLDPFANEIWLIQVEGKNKIMTSRDGYLKIANNNPCYQGMRSDAIYSNDTFKRVIAGENDEIFHSYDNLKDRGQLLGAYAKVYRSDRLVPSFFLAPMSNYDKGKGAWAKYPHAMIIKVAESMALKRAFSISGLCTQEELMTEEHNGGDIRRVRLQILWRDFLALNGGKGHEDEAKNLIKSLIGDKPSATWTEEEIGNLEDFLLRQEFIEGELE